MPVAATPNPHNPGRKRRAAGWTLLTLGLLVAAIWIASRWWFVASARIGVWRGCIHVAQSETPGSEGDLGLQGQLWGTIYQPGWQLWVDADQDRRNFAGVGVKDWQAGLVRSHVVPGVPATRRVVLLFWPLPLLLSAPAIFLLCSGIRARRRAITNACPKCGYSLAGLAPDSPCPECGKANAKG